MALLPPRLPGHLRPTHALGAGAFGEVWAAEGPAGPCAVKVLSPEASQDPAAAWAFGAEFRRLAQLEHPVFPRALEEGSTEEGRPFYVMELLNGGGGPKKGAWPLPWVEAVLRAVAEGLAHLHAKGYVHGDLKPENLLRAEDGRWVLLDLGMVSPIGQARDQVSGTLEYLAPEAFRKAPVGPAQDWYALGATAYEMLTGRPPFIGSPTELVRGHLLEAPPPLAPQAPEAPGAWVALVEALLTKDPKARLGSAPALRAALGDEVAPELLAAPPLTLREAPAWGMEGLLASWRALDLPGPGHRALAIVGGPGMGKTRALDELRLATLTQGKPWVGASCAAGAGAPAAPLRAALRQALAGRPLQDRTTAWLLGHSPEDLAALEPTARRAALLGAVAEDLEAAAEAMGGLAVGLDDWHLADQATREALASLWRSTEEAPLRWALASLPEVPGLPEGAWPLPDWDAAGLLTLVEGRLGAPAPPGLMAELEAVGAHSPGATHEALEEWVRVGRLKPSGVASWQLVAAPSGAGSAKLEGRVVARVQALGAEATRLASALAIAQLGGQPVAVGRLATLAGLSPGAAAAALDALVASALAIQEGGRAALSLPSTAQALQAASPGAPLKAWASALAREGRRELGASQDLDRLVGLARLALAGDDAALACALAAEAGRAALAGGSAIEAAQLLAAAEAHAPEDLEPHARLGLLLPLAEAERFADLASQSIPHHQQALELARTLGEPAAVAQAAYGLGKVCQLGNRYEEALQAWAECRSAAQLAQDPANGVRALVAEGRMRLFRGEPQAAATLALEATELAQGAHPAVLALALNLKAIVRLQEGPAAAREAAQWLEEARRLSEGLGDPMGELMAWDNLGNAHLYAGELAEAAEAFAQVTRRADALGMPVEGLFGELNLAIVACERGATAEGEARVAKVLRRAAQAGRKYPVGVAKALAGGLAWRSGRPQDALALTDEAIALGQELQHKLLEEFARNARLETLLALGQLEAAQAEALALAEVVAATDHAEMRDRLELHRAELARQGGGAWPEPALLQALAQGEQPILAHRAHQLLAHRALAEGQAELALDHAEAARRLAASWEAPFHQAEAAVLAARAAQAVGDEGSALDFARQAMGLALAEGQAHPLALAQAGLVLQALRGRAEAAPAFDASAPWLGPAFSALGGEGALAMRRAWGLEAWAARPTQAPSTGFGLQAESLAAWLQAISAARDDQEAAELALDAVADLAQAERGYVLAYEGGRLQSAITRGMDYAAEVQGSYSTSIASEALFSGEAIYLTNAGTSQFATAKSVVALELKTVLALPLATPEVLLGVVYVDRGTIEPVFSPAEIQLLQALVGQAAAAMVAHRRARKAEQALGHERRLAQFALGIARALPLEARRQAFLAQAMGLVGADRALWLEREEADPWRPVLGREGEAPCPAGATDFSQGVADWVSEQGRGTCLLDGAEDEDWKERASVQGLGLRTIWAVPLGKAVLYLDAGLIDEGDPIEALAELEAFAAAAAPELNRPQA